MTTCPYCGDKVTPERAEISPLCLSCAKQLVSRRVGFMDYSHKTAPALVMIDSRDKESVRLASRAFRRAR